MTWHFKSFYLPDFEASRLGDFFIFMDIRAEHLKYIYNPGTALSSTALNDVSFEIADGSFVALIGATGSGKTTLVELMCGLIPPTSGTVYVDGEDIFKKGYELNRLRFKIGLVFQYPEYQLFEEDVIRDVMFGPKNKGLSEEEALERAKKALYDVGIGEEFFKQSPFDLSGGQKKRVAIAGVLAMDPHVLILDEPTAGLDPEGRSEILSMLRSLHRERHMTIILVSHNMEDVAQCAEMVMVLRSGELMFFDTPKEVFRDAERLESYGLAVPEITYLARDLIRAGIEDIDCGISTVAEAREEIMRIFKRKNPG